VLSGIHIQNLSRHEFGLKQKQNRGRNRFGIGMLGKKSRSSQPENGFRLENRARRDSAESDLRCKPYGLPYCKSSQILLRPGVGIVRRTGNPAIQQIDHCTTPSTCPDVSQQQFRKKNRSGHIDGSEPFRRKVPEQGGVVHDSVDPSTLPHDRLEQRADSRDIRQIAGKRAFRPTVGRNMETGTTENIGNHFPDPPDSTCDQNDSLVLHKFIFYQKRRLNSTK